MFQYRNIPSKYINQLAKIHKIKYTGRSDEEIINDLVQAGQREKLLYLNEQFKFADRFLNLCKTESNFPEKSKTPEKFLETLIAEGHINRNNINTEWEPSLNPSIQICAVKHEGATVYLKLVEEKVTLRKNGYSKIPLSYAHFTPVAIHFGSEELIEVRCPYKEVKKYCEYIMKIMGFALPYKYFTVPKLTKENAKKLCSLLSAGVSSTHILLPTSVGSMRLNGKKGVNLDADNTFKLITNAIEKLGIPTNDTSDETCFFSFQDPVTSIVIEAKFEVNIKKNYFKFTTEVPQIVVDHVLDALVMINESDNQGEQQVATGLD
ncbi:MULTISPECIES: hypothetical protein [Geobacillus]|uniref:hypothetical protein n=1 Tax=Geobacillus TaxID=129337 RepID=UPI0001D581B5|nr:MULTISPECIES: hypothetical protein [Geobacillus]ADI25328.1 hypothetical protein GC56T3_0261 [Geobacillus sp. C56-T3]OQP16178.1 hypothetical protein B1693_09795 [Geobacillus zalihae]